MSLSYPAARRIVEAWRELSDGNQTARTYVALCDAMPGDDHDNYVAAVVALCAGIPHTLVELEAVAVAAGSVLDKVFTAKGGYASTRSPDSLDPVDFLGGADADR